MKKVLAVLMMFSISVLTFAAEKTVEKTEKKQILRKIASEQEVKCAANPNEGIGIDPDYIEKQVSKASSCYEESHIVESCGAGSSLDGITTAFAIKVCDKFAGKLSKADTDLKKRMSTRCNSVCNPETDGTMCNSQQSFCRLDVSKFISSVTYKEN